ncbi:hypothetical protein niasHT_023873 [Heterodera trifolii]|uniref:LysM domain-containing protein n=1 Tax=Heterodera trifolii TaxID=157864 RepID=A0ABD2JCW2_9BILA
MDQQCEENSFLCGSQRIRRYGSLSDSTFSRPKYKRIIVHKVMPTDTLQGLELRFKSSMYEIKRLNKLWSDQSLYCKPEILIPIFDDVNVSTQPSNENIRNNVHKYNGEELNEESIDQLFRRIDLGVKQTKKTVKKMVKKRVQINEIGD